MKSARFLSVFGALVLGLVLVQSASASVLKSTQVVMSDPRPAVSANYTFNFTHDTASTIQTVSMYFCKEPSWAEGCTFPTGLNVNGISDIASRTGLDAQWTLANKVGNLITVSRPSSGQVIGDDTIISLTFNGITNPAIAGCNANGTNISTGTCYVHIGTYNNDDSTESLVDSAVASFTVVRAVEVTARVDPTFTFVVEGVDTGAEHNLVTTSVSTTFSTLPFGNLTAGAPKYAAHKLTVTTNTTSGYTVSVKMVSPMTGVYAANNIDAFTGSPHAAWTEPGGNVPSVDTGWIGFNTDDNDVTDWDGTGDENQFAGVLSTGESVVMKKTASDNGNVSNYVSYAIEVNVYQPADTYTGTLYYNALPTY